MFKLKNNIDQKINEVKLVQILFYMFPLSFLVGNLLVTLNLLLLVLISLIVLKKEQLKFSFKSSYWLLIFFFVYIILLTTIQFQRPGYLYDITNWWEFKSDPTYKSFFLLRFLVFIFIIDVLFSNKILKLNNFFLVSLICTSFVSFDIIFQYLTGYDVFGYKGSEMPPRNSGPFGDEWISGSYLQKFSFFSFFYIFGIYKNIKFKNTLLISIIIIHLTALLLSGNRMPFILFIFACILIILLIKKLRITMSLSLIIFLAIFSLIIKNDPTIKNYYYTIWDKTLNRVNFSQIIKTGKINEESFIRERKSVDVVQPGTAFLRTSGHGAIYRTAFILWKEQPLFGHGLKSFRVKCWEVLEREGRKLKKGEGVSGGGAAHFACSTHAHNYYLELLAEVGLIGTSLLIIFFIILLKDSYYFLKKYNQKIDTEIVFIIPFIIVTFLEIWPIKSSGSFFTTWNATIIWLCIGILMASKLKKSI